MWHQESDSCFNIAEPCPYKGTIMLHPRSTKADIQLIIKYEDMKFKTNAKCAGCSSAILAGVRREFPDQEWSLDLASADKVLENHGVPEDAAMAARVVKAIEETGFKGSWLTQGEENL